MKATRARSASFNCKLNSYYKSLQKEDNFRILRDRETTWGDYASEIINKNGETICSMYSGDAGRNTNCCGIDELVFLDVSKEHFEMKNKKIFDEFTAKYIKYSIFYEESKDKRVVFIGLPVKVKSNSVYNSDYYIRLRASLERLGFVKLNARPYKNKNSSNSLTVMAGQFP